MNIGKLLRIQMKIKKRIVDKIKGEKGAIEEGEKKKKKKEEEKMKLSSFVWENEEKGIEVLSKIMDLSELCKVHACDI